MRSIRSSLFLALAAFVLSCGGSKPPPSGPSNQAGEVGLTISSVTLADDCGTGPTTEPDDESEVALAAPPVQAGEAASQAYEPGASMSQRKRACEQSSVQLRVENGTKAGAAIEVKKVELLDESGGVIGELEAREPSRWAEDVYEPWNQQVAPTQVLQVSYALSAPAVHAGGTYTVRVTIASGDGERTLERKTTLEAPASLPPGAVT